MVHPGTGDLAGWQLEPHEAWRFELFEPPAETGGAEDLGDLLELLPEPYLTVEVGLQTREGTEAWLRVGDDPALWQTDRSPRPLLDPTWQTRPSGGATPGDRGQALAQQFGNEGLDSGGASAFEGCAVEQDRHVGGFLARRQAELFADAVLIGDAEAGVPEAEAGERLRLEVVEASPLTRRLRRRPLPDGAR